MVSKLGFIIGATAFILFVTQIGAEMGVTIFGNAPDAPTPPEQPSGFFGAVFYPFSNIVYFFSLASVSGGYAFLSVIISMLVVGIIWSIFELIRGN